MKKALYINTLILLFTSFLVSCASSNENSKKETPTQEVIDISNKVLVRNPNQWFPKEDDYYFSYFNNRENLPYKGEIIYTNKIVANGDNEKYQLLSNVGRVTSFGHEWSAITDDCSQISQVKKDRTGLIYGNVYVIIFKTPEGAEKYYNVIKSEDAGRNDITENKIEKGYYSKSYVQTGKFTICGEEATFIKYTVLQNNSISISNAQTLRYFNSSILDVRSAIFGVINSINQELTKNPYEIIKIADTPTTLPAENHNSDSSPNPNKENSGNPEDYISDEYIYCDTSGQYYIAGHVTNTSQRPIIITASGNFPGFATNSSYYVSGSIIVPPGSSRFSEPIGSAYTEIGAEGEVFEIYCDFSDFEYEWAD